MERRIETTKETVKTELGTIEKVSVGEYVDGKFKGGHGHIYHPKVVISPMPRRPLPFRP